MMKKYVFSVVSMMALTTAINAQNVVATASSVQDDQTVAAKAVDGSADTRWSSQFNDDQWLSVDLGTVKNITGVNITWETAFGKEFKIQVSKDGNSWIDAFVQKDGKGGTESITFSQTQSGRYVRMLGLKRGTDYGYSIFEFEVKTTNEKPSAAVSASSVPVATASSVENDQTVAAKAVDGSADTRWSSQGSDDQWLRVDLGTVKNITGVNITWETAFGKEFKIQVSNDGDNWFDAFVQKDGKGGTEAITFSQTQSGRYVRMLGLKRGTDYGYSIFEFEVKTTNEKPIAAVNVSSAPVATASSVENDQNVAKNAIDGDASTRWSSQGNDDQWLSVDLGTVKNITGVNITWETAYGKAFKIQVSKDGNSWTDAFVQKDGKGGMEDITFPQTQSGRYVRMLGQKRGTEWGYSIFEFNIKTN